MTQQSTRLLVPVVAGAAALAVTAGSAFLLHRHRNTFGQALWRWRRRDVVHGTSRRVVVVETQQQWTTVAAEVIRCSHELGCLGFDCEWVTAKASRRPVALLQLATHSGLCVLVRLCKLDTVPLTLLELLSDGSVVKVGVAPSEDCRLLYDDYGIVVNGALDLRDLFMQSAAIGPTKKKKKRGKHKGSKLDDAFQAGLLAGRIRANNLKEGVDNVNESARKLTEPQPLMTKELKERETIVEKVDSKCPGRGESRGELGASGCGSEPSSRDDSEDEVSDSADVGSVETTLIGGELEGLLNGTSKVDSSSGHCTVTKKKGDDNTPRSQERCNKMASHGDAQQNGSEALAATFSSYTTGKNSSSPVSKDDVSIRKTDEMNSSTCNGDNNNVVCKRSYSEPSPGEGVLNGRVVTGVAGPTKLGLSALADFYLGRTLDKDWRVRASDWEADHLTVRQSSYAAEDARSGLHVLLMLLDLVVPLSVSWPLQPLCRSGDKDEIVAKNKRMLLVISSDDEKERARVFFGLIGWSSLTRGMVAEVGARHAQCASLGGYKTVPDRKCIRLTDQASNAASAKGYRRAYSLRKSPLYHNSILWAPDDEPLCTVDPKKAYWYVDNGLGEVVQEDPLIVRLNFEPTGRPQKEGADGNFYLNERENKCVVCGKDQSYIRKNIVPHEYRKHFPEILKSHQNHDVVLLCTDCHQLSNQRDAILRYQLAEIHDAPIGNASDVKVVVDGNLKMIKSAGNALLKNMDRMPVERIEELTVFLQEYFNTDDLTDVLITKAAELNVAIVNDSYEPHGLRVFKHYEKIGIIQFEKLWRENFLKTMEPRFMPTGWSITHNHEKLRLKMSRHPLDDPIREQFRLALVGSEGHVDIPFKPQQHRPKRVLAGKRPKGSQQQLQKTTGEEDEEGDNQEEGDDLENVNQEVEVVINNDNQEEDEKENEKEWLSKYMYFKE